MAAVNSPATVVVVSQAELDAQLSALQEALGEKYQVRLARHIPAGDDVDVLVVPPGTTLSGEQLSRLDALRAVATTSVGIDHLDVAAVADRDLPLITAHGFNSREVADHTLACVLTIVRDLPAGVRRVRAGHWGSLATHPRRISSTTLGLLGFGDIARLVAADARRLGMEVVVWNRSRLPRQARDQGIRQATLREVLSAADVLSLHLPLTDETRGIIGAAQLSVVRDGLGLVNTARAELVDEAALIAALDSGRIGQAWLDVMPSEPPEPSNLLLGRDDVFVTPHMGWLSEQSRIEGYRLVGERLRAALD